MRTARVCLLLLGLGLADKAATQSATESDSTIAVTSLPEFVGTYSRFAGSPQQVEIVFERGKLFIQGARGGGGELQRESDTTFRFAGSTGIEFVSEASGEYDSFELTGGGSKRIFTRTETLKIAYRKTAGQLRPHAVSDAVLMGDEPSLAFLIQAGADVEELDTRTEIAGRNGRRPLNWAALADRPLMIRLLLDAGANIDLANRSGFTPLHHAAEAGATAAVKLLLERGADALLKTARGQTALEVALRRSARPVIELLETATDAQTCGEKDCTPVDLATSGYQVPEDAGDGLVTGSLQEVHADQAIVARLLANLEKGVFNRVDSLLISKDGKLVVEQYYNGWSADRAHMMQSVSKSITSLLVGSALHQGLLASVGVPILGLLPDHAHLLTDEKATITIEDLLTMSAGFDWDEANPAYGQPGNIRFKEVFSPDPVAFTLSTEFVNEPGTVFTYSGGYVTVVGAILQKVFGKESVLDALHTSTLAGLDFENLRWQEQAGGYQNTAGGVLMRPRDLAKIGQLMLNGGVWKGKRLLSQEWVDASLARHVSTPSDWNEYGYYWWGRSFTTDKGTYQVDAARGWGGQELILVDALDLVVVLTATNYQTPTPLNAILANSILPAFEN